MISAAELEVIQRAASDSATAARRHERAAAAHERAAQHMASRGGGTANTWTVTLGNGTTGLWLACGAAVLGLLIAMVTVALSCSALVIAVVSQQDMQSRYEQLLVWTQEEGRMWRSYAQTGHLQPMRPIPGATPDAGETQSEPKP